MRVLKRAKSQDRVLMSVDDNNFIITFEGDATRTFKIRLIDIEYDNPVPPSIEHPTNFKVRFSILKDSINDIDIFSDKIMTVNSVMQASNIFTVKIFKNMQKLYSHWIRLEKCLKQINFQRKPKLV